MYNEQDFLMLSGIQHFVFCKRQWALIHIEQQWLENQRTIEGLFMHEKAHEAKTEIKNDMIITRSMPVLSRELGIQGVCDVVEFTKSEDGISLHGHRGKYMPTPVEYKRGKPKEHDADILQLCAQAMCLEEMLVCEIMEGFLFYGEPRRRTHAEFTSELRLRVNDCFKEMHELYKRKHTPNVKKRKSCNICSLINVCLPKITEKSASNYIKKYLKDEDMQ